MEGAIVSHNWAHDSPKAGFRFDSSPGWVMMIMRMMMVDDYDDDDDDNDDNNDVPPV